MANNLKFKKLVISISIACSGLMCTNVYAVGDATNAITIAQSLADQAMTKAESAINQAVTQMESMTIQKLTSSLIDKTIDFVGKKVDDMTSSLMNNFTDNFTKFNKLTEGAADKLMGELANAGKLKLGANGQAAEGDGLSKPDQIANDLMGLKNSKTVPDMLLGIAQKEQKIRLDEQANLAVYLDSAVGNVPCKQGAGRCTILKYLQEQVAGQVDKLQSDVVDAGAFWIDPKTKMSSPTLFSSAIYNIGFTDKTGKDPKSISSFLSPAPMIPAGFEPDYTKGALTPERAKVLGDALVGLSDFRDYMNAEEFRTTPGGRIVQAKIMTRFARMQLARHAIMQVNHKSVSDAMNVEFKACVIRPNKEDAIGAHPNQHLVNIQQLLKCNNLSLMHMRRIQMEQSRLMGAMLATLLDQWAFSTSSETGNTINHIDVK